METGKEIIASTRFALRSAIMAENANLCLLMKCTATVQGWVKILMIVNMEFILDLKSSPKLGISPPIWGGDVCNESKCDLECVHGGTCEWADDYKGKYCACPAGFEGDFCQHDTSQDVSQLLLQL